MGEEWGGVLRLVSLLGWGRGRHLVVGGTEEDEGRLRPARVPIVEPLVAVPLRAPSTRSGERAAWGKRGKERRESGREEEEGG